MSQAEREMYGHLSFMEVRFVEQCADFQPWTLDFYIGEWHLCVEVDGPYMHHSPAANAKRDADLLERYGIPTLRFDVKRRQPTRTEVMLKVLNFIEEHEPTTKERIARWRQQQLSV